MKSLFLIVVFFLSLSIFGQKIPKIDSVQVSGQLFLDPNEDEIIFKNPMRAGLYSAILPGLGQTYNGKYWKVPLAWGLVGSGVGFTVYLNNRYHKYRDAYLAELNGEPHRFSGIYDVNVLAKAQDKAKRDRDYAIALSILAYIVNIVDATVDAHLDQVRKDKELNVQPTAFFDPVTEKINFGLNLNFKL
ncbi:DUF5683 domain-containing protein [Candidatus Ornithobacterium hominis]|uniref:DUF5683 domain-containing protein n=1 Tax=Candidatus Ornithobacterium hominis TaxID=2497989 RepID=UPI0024BD12B9|nr:DUF5683 domain-containing protein [Candidatus Ornithobacterium hominis]CAI9430203.1 DUF5683 domain-containing protein [Candidatus Ornithobacterium hominis]